jgi:hypothetical protein
MPSGLIFKPSTDACKLDDIPLSSSFIFPITFCKSAKSTSSPSLIFRINLYPKFSIFTADENTTSLAILCKITKSFGTNNLPKASISTTLTPVVNLDKVVCFLHEPIQFIDFASSNPTRYTDMAENGTLQNKTVLK